MLGYVKEIHESSEVIWGCELQIIIYMFQLSNTSSSFS